jgi:DNA-binding NarL/FixJ family response regulator
MLSSLKNKFSHDTVIESESITSFNGNYEGKTVDLIAITIGQTLEMNDILGILKTKIWYPAASIIVFGGKPDSNVAAAYLNAGVSGYLSNESESWEFDKCVEDVLAGKKYVSQETLWMLLQFSGTKNAVSHEADSILTMHQYQIAKYLCDGKRNTWIATDLSLKASTISTIKATIFRKLRVEDIQQLRVRMKDPGSIIAERKLHETFWP